MNQPEAHTLLQIMRAIVDIAAPGVLLKAEAIVPTRELPAYFGADDARECQVAYHSTLMAASWAALAEQDTTLLKQVISATPALPPAACWLTYVRCHDDIGWNVLRDEAGSDDRLARIAAHYNSGGGVAFQTGPGRAVHGTNGTAASLAAMDAPGGAQRVLLLHALALSFGALPVLYMGDELAMENDDAYLDDPERAHDTRWVQRAAFDQARHAQRLQRSSAAGTVFGGLLKLIARRRGIDALAAHAPRTLLATPQRALLALARGEHFLALFNFSGQPLTLTLDGMGAWTGEVQLAPWSHRWLERTAP